MNLGGRLLIVIPVSDFVWLTQVVPFSSEQSLSCNWILHQAADPCDVTDTVSFFKSLPIWLNVVQGASAEEGGGGGAQRSGLQAVSTMIRVRELPTLRRLFLLQKPQTGSGDHPAFYSVGTWGFFPRGRRPGCGSDHSPSSRVHASCWDNFTFFYKTSRALIWWQLVLRVG